MSWVIIAVAAIFIIFGAAGWKKGLIKIALSLASMIITIIVCVWVTPAVCKAIKQNTDVCSAFQKSIYKFIINDESFNKAADESADAAAVTADTEGLTQYVSQIESCAAEIMKKLNFPDSVIIQTNNASDDLVSDITAVTGEAGVTIKSAAAAVVAARLAELALNAIVYIIIFAAVFLVLKIICGVTGIITRLPVIHEANQVLGLVCGLAEGLVAVWILFTVITAFGNAQWAAKALTEIGGNGFLSFIYDKNPIIKTIIKSV